MSSADRDARLRALAAARFRISLGLTGAMVLLYFGFITLVAFGKAWLGEQVVPGLSRGILLGALVILLSFCLTFVYVWWANRHYDAELERLRGDG